MESGSLERIRELKLMAKWSQDNREKKQAISQLLRCGNLALPAIQEILAVTAYNDVKQACIDAISALGRKERIPAINTKVGRPAHIKKKNKHKQTRS